MFKEIIVITNSHASDDVADIMWSLGANGVKVMDPNDLDFILHSDTCWDYVEDNLLNQSQEVKVSFFVEDYELEEKIEELKLSLKSLEKKYGDMTIQIEDVPDVNWEEDWKKFYKPISAGKYTIMAEWIEEDVEGIVIMINPSKAFGTGEHASTRLCLTLMSDLDFSNLHVIDVGAGSGILGIGAAKSGAKLVDMCDIDKETLECAQENAVLNGVEDKIVLTAGGIDSITPVKADVLLCNLTADILNRIVEDLSHYIKNKGIVVCSGILDTRVDELIKVFREHNFVLTDKIDEGEWVGVKFVYGD